MATRNNPIVHPIIVPVKSSLRSYNFFLVETNGAYILVDAGEDSNACWAAFLNVLKEVGIKLHDIEAIFLTHGHADHVGLVNKICRQHSIPIFSHPNALKSLRRDESYLKQRIIHLHKTYAMMGAGEKEIETEVSRLYEAIEKNRHKAIKEPVQFVTEGDTFYGFRVIELFGHTQDHIALYDETTGILLAGDHLLKKMTTNALIDFDPQGKRMPVLSMYEDSLYKLKNKYVTKVYPGHGEWIDEPYAEINSHLRKLNKQAKRMIDLLQGEMTVAEVAQKMYGSRYKQLFPLVMSLVIGHFDRLEARGYVKKRYKDGVYYYGRTNVLLQEHMS